jgi:hypothetical protein
MRLPMLRFLFLLFPLLFSACSSADPPAARQASPYVDALKDARSVESATEDATRAREDAVKAIQP